MPELQLSIWDILASTGITTLVVAISLFFLKGPISSFLNRAATHNYDEKLAKLEALLTAEAKDREQISSYILKGKQGRDDLLNTKRLEAAEFLCREIERIEHQLGGVVTTVQSLDLGFIRKHASASDVKKIMDIFSEGHRLKEKMKENTLTSMVLPKLYLDEEIIQLFHAYEGLHLFAVLTISTLEYQSEAERFMNLNGARETVERLYPSTKEGFDKIDENLRDNLAYSYLPTIREALLRKLRGAAGFQGSDAHDHASALGAVARSYENPQELRSLKESDISKSVFRDPADN
jgi:hypothetical protein